MSVWGTPALISCDGVTPIVLKKEIFSSGLKVSQPPGRLNAMIYAGIDETKAIVDITEGVAGRVGDAAAGRCSIVTLVFVVAQ